MLKVEKERVKRSQIFGFFILLHKRIQIDSHKYTTAVFKFIQHKKDKKRKKSIKSISITSSL